jgi:hypothetical protein
MEFTDEILKAIVNMGANGYSNYDIALELNMTPDVLRDESLNNKRLKDALERAEFNADLFKLIKIEEQILKGNGKISQIEKDIYFVFLLKTLFRKGVSGNPNGRKRGKPNRSTAEIKTAFQNLLDANLDQMEKDLKTLTAKERLSVLLKLADFVLPRIQSVQAESEKGDNEIIITVVDSNGEAV